MGLAKRLERTLLTTLVVFSFATAAYGGQRVGVRRRGKPAGPKFVPGEVIVKFKTGAAKSAIERSSTVADRTGRPPGNQRSGRRHRYDS